MRAPAVGGLAHRAHQAQLLGDLDDDDTRVLGDREEHAPQPVGVLPLAPLAASPALTIDIRSVSLSQGGTPQRRARALRGLEALQALDDARHLIAEGRADALAHVRQGDHTAGERWVDQHGHQRHGVDAQRLGQGLRGGNRLGQRLLEVVNLAGRALTAIQRAALADLVQKAQRVGDGAHVVWLQICLDGLEQPPLVEERRAAGKCGLVCISGHWQPYAELSARLVASFACVALNMGHAWRRAQLAQHGVATHIQWHLERQADRRFIAILVRRGHRMDDAQPQRGHN